MPLTRRFGKMLAMIDPNGTKMQQFHIAYFISSHGFGHASRSAAIIQSVVTKNPDVKITIYTETPRWFFEESLTVPFYYRKTQTDVGVIQITPIEMDIPGTLTKLNRFLADLPENSTRIADLLLNEKVDFVIADISPLAIVGAEKAGIPSLLIENFTWDWIYQPFARNYPGFEEINRKLAQIYDSAMYRGQYSPPCAPSETSDFILPPVSRCPRTAPETIRAKLGLAANEKLALVAMGGVSTAYKLKDRINSADPNIVFAFSGDYLEISRRNNILRIPHRSEIYHPDLVNSADFLFGKAGYSTYSEIVNMQKPFAYLLRPDFRESAVLGQALKNTPGTFEIDALSFSSFSFDPWIEKMSAYEKHQPTTNGSDLGADNILFLMRSGKPRQDLLTALQVAPARLSD